MTETITNIAAVALISVAFCATAFAAIAANIRESERGAALIPVKVAMKTYRPRER